MALSTIHPINNLIGTTKKFEEGGKFKNCGLLQPLQQNDDSWSRPGARDDKMPVSPIPCCHGREGAPAPCAGALTCVEPDRPLRRLAWRDDPVTVFHVSLSVAGPATISTSDGGIRVCAAIATDSIHRARLAHLLHLRKAPGACPGP